MGNVCRSGKRKPSRQGQVPSSETLNNSSGRGHDSLNDPSSDTQEYSNNSSGRRQRDVKNLLIIGPANSGKSTLANVICNTEDFEENERTISDSKDFQQYDFVWKDTSYRVVDIRVKLMEREILCKIGQVIHSMPEGISQILFVVDQLTAEEIEKLIEIEDEIFKIEICKYTTIVRTKFKDFKSEDKRKKDEEDLCGLKKLPRIHIVHVDNPPIPVCVRDSVYDGTVRNNNRRREKSRIILLEHLNKVCSERYKLNMWNKLCESDKSIDSDNLEELAKRVKTHLELHDSVVANIIKKLITNNN